MFGRRVTLFELLGFKINVDLVGILVLKDMLKLLALKENLEGSGSHGLGSCD